jgi:hypothetical protein
MQVVRLSLFRDWLDKPPSSRKLFGCGPFLAH